MIPIVGKLITYEANDGHWSMSAPQSACIQRGGRCGDLHFQDQQRHRCSRVVSLVRAGSLIPSSLAQFERRGRNNATLFSASGCPWRMRPDTKEGTRLESGTAPQR